MKAALQIVAAFMAPLAMVFWVYALAKIAMYLLDWPLGAALWGAVAITICQGLVAFAALDFGFIRSKQRGME